MWRRVAEATLAGQCGRSVVFAGGLVAALDAGDAGELAVDSGDALGRLKHSEEQRAKSKETASSIPRW